MQTTYTYRNQTHSSLYELSEVLWQDDVQSRLQDRC